MANYIIKRGGAEAEWSKALQELDKINEVLYPLSCLIFMYSYDNGTHYFKIFHSWHGLRLRGQAVLIEKL